MSRELTQMEIWIEQALRKPKGDAKLIQDVEDSALALMVSQTLQASIDENVLTPLLVNLGGSALAEAGVEPTGNVGVDNKRKVKIGNFLMHILVEKNKIKYDNSQSEDKKGFDEGEWRVFKADDSIIVGAKKKKNQDPYTIEILDDKFIDGLMCAANVQFTEAPMASRPQVTMPETIVGFYSIAGELIRNAPRNVRRRVDQGKADALLVIVNKANNVGYRVNGDILDVYKACKNDPIFTLANKDASFKQKESVRSARTNVLEIAETVRDRVVFFYHFFDNRVGRIYSCANYLKHDGCGLSKSILDLANRERIGTDGWFWMRYHAANCWGEDKLGIDARVDFADSCMDEWMLWAMDPVGNKGWQQADSPFEFLAAIMDMYKATNPDGSVNYEYESGLKVAFDASCSGLQVLSAVSRDIFSGEMCNLTGEERGDYYLTISDVTWERMKITDEDVAIYDEVVEALKGIRTFYEFNEKSKELGDKMKVAGYVFWSRKHKLRRKISKRMCMTYFYKCQTETMANSLYKDWRTEDGFKDLNPAFCYILADLTFKTCQRVMKGPTQVMELLVKLGMLDYKKGENFSCTTPYTKVQMEQSYNQWKTSPVWLHNKNIEGGRFRLRVITSVMDSLRIHKIKSSTAANWVHMCDSQIPAWLFMNCDYDVSAVHDSFSCTPANAGKLYEDTRQAFYDIFKPDVLMELLKEKDAMHLLEEVEVGDPDFLDDLFDQQYNFS